MRIRLFSRVKPRVVAGVAAALTALGIAAAVTLAPGAIGNSPEKAARNYLEMLMSNPSGSGNKPLNPMPDLPTSNAVNFLHARLQQGATHRIEVENARSSTPGRHRALLQVLEQGVEQPVRGPRFYVDLEQADDGVWRVAGVGIDE